jgi:hypothetical protein
MQALAGVVADGAELGYRTGSLAKLSLHSWRRVLMRASGRFWRISSAFGRVLIPGAGIEPWGDPAMRGRNGRKSIAGPRVDLFRGIVAARLYRTFQHGGLGDEVVPDPTTRE